MLKRLLFLSVFLIISAVSANAFAVAKATAPIPLDGAVDVIDAQGFFVLEWTKGDGTPSHNVYIGTDYNAVNAATTASAEFMRNIPNSRPAIYSTKNLVKGVQYFWRIDEVTGTTTIKGDVWTFRTYDGLIGWWKMDADDSAGSVVADSSGNGYDGTKSGDIKWDNGSLKFTSDYSAGITFAPTVVEGLFDSIDETVTVSFWMDVAHDNSRMDIFTGKVETARRFALEMFSDSNNLWAYIGDNGDKLIRWGVGNPESSNYQAFPNRWAMITLTKDINGGVPIDLNNPALGKTGIIKLYIDGLLLQSTTRTEGWDGGGHPVNGSLAGIDFFTISGGDNVWYKGNLKDFRLYDRVLSASEIDGLTGGYFLKARAPSPVDGSRLGVEENEVELTLSWQAGHSAASHDVYFGTDFDDVHSATSASLEFMGSQYGNSFETGILTPGIYYWRIDEINGVNVWTGEVWSFEVTAMPQPVLWLKMDGPTLGKPEDFVRDYSVFGNHGTMGSSDQWIDIPGYGGGIDFAGASGSATQVAFANDGNDLLEDMGLTDQVTISFLITGHTPGDTGYVFTGLNAESAHIMSMEAATGDTKHFLTKMGTGPSNWVWNAFDPEKDSYIFNISDVRRLTVTVDFTIGKVIYYLDSDVWATFDNDIAGNFADMKSFVIAWNKNNGYDMTMSDFRIYDQVLFPEHIKVLVGDYPKLARKPVPANQSVGNALDTILRWQPGVGAVKHDVYFGYDYNTIENADTSSSSCYLGRQTETIYDPNTLEVFGIYYWRIDEVDAEGEIVKGPVWKFNTIDSIMVENFESYDDEGNSIGDVWTDRYGYLEMEIALNNPTEGGPVVSPVNSMRLMYHVPYDPYYSIAACTFSSAQDWTANGVRILTIHYYGDATNMELPAFVTVGDGTNDANVFVDVNTLVAGWGEMNVSLPEIELLGVDLSNVTYMEIGFGDGTNQGMSFNRKNTIYIDDIVLYPAKCVLSESSLQADLTGDCIVNYNDLDAFALNWLLAGYTVTAAPVSNDGKVLHYNFENNTIDSVAGNNGTLQNLGSAATYDAGHGGGKCIHFNATSTSSGSNMIVPSAAFESLEDAVTFSFWLKKDEAVEDWYQALFAGHGQAVDHREIFMSYAPAEATNLVTLFTAGSDGPVRWSSEEGISFIQPQPFDYKLWHHYAMVKNVKLGHMCLYVDGKLEIFRTGKFKPITDCDTFRLGSYIDFEAGTENGFARGSFDDFRVYNRALSHAEVLTLAGQASATVTLGELGAVKADFNDDDAIDFKDYSILASEWLVEDFWP